jgi:hypothetical protein
MTARLRIWREAADLAVAAVAPITVRIGLAGRAPSVSAARHRPQRMART